MALKNGKATRYIFHSVFDYLRGVTMIVTTMVEATSTKNVKD